MPETPPPLDTFYESLLLKKGDYSYPARPQFNVVYYCV